MILRRAVQSAALGVLVGCAALPIARAAETAPPVQPAISEEAGAAVSAMGKTLSAKDLSFTAKVIRVYLDPSGQPLHIFHTIKVVARRPDRLTIEVSRCPSSLPTARSTGPSPHRVTSRRLSTRCWKSSTSIFRWPASLPTLRTNRSWAGSSPAGRSGRPRSTASSACICFSSRGAASMWSCGPRTTPRPIRPTPHSPSNRLPARRRSSWVQSLRRGRKVANETSWFDPRRSPRFGGRSVGRSRVPRPAGPPADGWPADGWPADGSPPDGSPPDGSPPDGCPPDGCPADGCPADGCPADGSHGRPADGSHGRGGPPRPPMGMGGPPGPAWGGVGASSMGGFSGGPGGAPMGGMPRPPMGGGMPGASGGMAGAPWGGVGASSMAGLPRGPGGAPSGLGGNAGNVSGPLNSGNVSGRFNSGNVSGPLNSGNVSNGPLASGNVSNGPVNSGNASRTVNSGGNVNASNSGGNVNANGAAAVNSGNTYNGYYAAGNGGGYSGGRYGGGYYGGGSYGGGYGRGYYREGYYRNGSYWGGYAAGVATGAEAGAAAASSSNSSSNSSTTYEYSPYYYTYTCWDPYQRTYYYSTSPCPSTR